MNRRLTNWIRLIMDECIPPFIRDSRWFMYPFYRIAYRGGNIREIMDFKKHVYGFSRERYMEFYAGLDSISRNRETDLNEASIRALIGGIPADARSLLDVGCGRGYFLDRVAQARPGLELMGCDVVDKLGYKDLRLELGQVEQLPFADDSFDVVTCSHTLEHVIDPAAAVAELKRVTRRVLAIVVPRQRYYFYTLDEHVNFYPQKEPLEQLLGLDRHSCRDIQGDWLYLGHLDGAPESAGTGSRPGGPSAPEV